MKKTLYFLIMFLPSRLKILLLRMMGHSIHSTAYIGFSFLDIKSIVMEKNTYIGHFNVFSNLQRLFMQEGSRINRYNKVASGKSYHGILEIGQRTSISLRHYLDVTDKFLIGHDTIVAGHRSTFFTHSKGVEIIDYTKPIIIGNWCYIGSDSKFAPGAVIGDGVFVGMGAVVVGDYSCESYCLLAGNPAKVKKIFSANAPYFKQGKLKHHHLKGCSQ